MKSLQKMVAEKTPKRSTRDLETLIYDYVIDSMYDCAPWFDVYNSIEQKIFTPQIHRLILTERKLK